MLDVQKERFRQLMASAILDLWKKETGSLASVFIEATVCITSCNSRMTVIQLSDHFPGLIPEPPAPPGVERAFKVAGTEAVWSTPGRPGLQLAGQKRKLPEDCIHRRKKPEMVAIGGGGGTTAPRDVTARRHHHQQQQRHLLTDNNNNPTVDVDDDDNDDDDDEEGDGDFSEETDKEEEDSEEESEDEAEDQRRSTSGDSTSGTLGLVVPGATGLVYQTHGKPSPATDKAKAAEDDSAIQDMSTGSLVIDMSLNDDDDCSNNNSLVDSKYQTGEVRSSSSHPTRQKTNGVSGGVDPTQHDADLLISSPQNYTEQVRDVIRSRLLNGKAKTKYPGEFFQMPITGSTPKSFEVSSPTMGGLARPFDVTSAWSLIKREKTGVVMDGRIFQQHFPPSPAALHLIPSRKSFMDAVVGSAQLPDCHPAAALQQFFGIGNGSLEPSESKVFPEPSKATAADPDENPDTGLTRAFTDQKIGKFDGGGGGVLPDGNSSSTAPNNNEQKTYKCGFCQKTFLFKSKYHEHLPVHTSARPFECHMCTRTYKYKYDLRVHLRTHLGIPTKSTICPFCSGKFLTNKLLRNHIKEEHREQQQITEEQCAQSLDNVAALSPSVSSG